MSALPDDARKALEGFNSDRPLIVGTIAGLRSFKVTPEGKLTAVIDEKFVYHDGVNKATCTFNDTAERLKIDRDRFTALLAEMKAPITLGELPPDLQPHRVAAKDCSCGFYAYTTTSNIGFHSPSQLMGVIEGQGLVTVGTKGFRAEKGQVVALVEPSKIYNPLNIHLALILVLLFFTAFSLIVSLASMFQNLEALSLSILATFLSVGIDVDGAALSVARTRKDYKKFLETMAPPADELIEKVKENYPSITWYSSRRKLLKAYPSIKRGSAK